MIRSAVAVELCWDKPKEVWPYKADGSINMKIEPLDLDSLLEETVRRCGGNVLIG